MTNDPFWRLDAVAPLAVRSPDFEHGARLPAWARAKGAGGADRSPELRWTDAPEGTKSFAVRVYDPDAPTMSGWWHWIVYDIPAGVDHLARDAGTPGSGLLPPGAVTHPNELGVEAFGGAAPPAGHGEHRYFFVVSALGIDHLDVPPGTSPAVLGALIRRHELARGFTTGTQITE